MIIRKHILILITIILPWTIKSQAYIQPGVQAALDAFISYSNAGEWDKAFDLLYPKLFTQVSKQDLIDIMESMETDGMSLTMSNAKITSTTAPMREGDETFIRVEYSSDVTVHIEKNGQYGSGKKIQALDGQFRSTYGEENVEWNEDLYSFKIMANKAMIAIDIGSKEWKLVEINLDQPELMEFLFSPSVFESLVRVE